MKQIFILGLLFILNCGSEKAINPSKSPNIQTSETNVKSVVLFSRSKGALNAGYTINLMIYDPEDKSEKLLLKGSVAKRGEYNAVTSPDNSKIIFNTYRFSGWKLGIADFSEGKISGVQRLTDRPNYEYNAKFSPDGMKTVYQEFSWNTRDTDIFIADKNGKNAVHFVKSKGGDRTPAWTKDGMSIVFTSARGGNYDIFLKSIKNKSVKALTNNNATDFAPSTSKSQDKIAFLSDREGKINLFVMSVNGKELKNLTPQIKTDRLRLTEFEDDGGWAYKTSWSPDGKQIVFNAPVNGNLELFIVNEDGTGLTQITDNNDSDISPFWTNQ